MYVNDRLATVLKRNQLTTAPRWRLGDVLARQGIATAQDRASRTDPRRAAHGDVGVSDGLELAIRRWKRAGENRRRPRAPNAIALYTKSSLH